mmetsp:Transcript_43092/g.52271  ORF Transcript_43092/g.52271 Transcript_43092/m.52271 type:complete len:98 (-) Transcript_43092:300-593(-)
MNLSLLPQSLLSAPPHSHTLMIHHRPFIEVLFKTLSLRPENGIAATTTSTPHESNSSNENRLTALLPTLSIRDGELGRTIRTCADLTETVGSFSLAF